MSKEGSIKNNTLDNEVTKMNVSSSSKEEGNITNTLQSKFATMNVSSSSEKRKKVEKSDEDDLEDEFDNFFHEFENIILHIVFQESNIRSIYDHMIAADLNDDLQFVVPVVNPEIKRLLMRALAETPTELPIQFVDGHSHQVMSAADVVLLASGTATLEALLLNRPMVVAYQQSKITYAIYRRMLFVEHISLPNLLAGKTIVDELIQDDATPESLGCSVAAFLDSTSRVDELKAEYQSIRTQLTKDASDKAADVVIQVAGS